MSEEINVGSARVLLVGLSHAIFTGNFVDFFSDVHFLDHDVVFLDPKGALFGEKNDYRKSVLDNVLSIDNPERGARFLKRYRDVCGRLVEFVDSGGAAFVYLRNMPTLKYEAWEAGRYREKQVNLNHYLPWGKTPIRTVVGENIEFAGKGKVADFFKQTAGLWRYEATFVEPPDGASIAHVKGHSSDVLSDITITNKRGFALQTPIPNLDSIDENESSLDRQKRIFEAAIKLANALKKDLPTPTLPEWADEYLLPGEEKILSETFDLQREIQRLTEEVEQREEQHQALSGHKALFTAFDSQLEDAVDRIFVELGFSVVPGPKGRVDRIATIGDRKVAIEIQGVKRGAKEDHARSLTIWVEEVAIADKSEPKGLLIVNPYRDTPLNERVGLSFWPGKTLNICQRHGHCAMTTLQLLVLYFASQDEGQRNFLIDSIFDTEGEYPHFKDWQTVIQMKPGPGN